MRLLALLSLTACAGQLGELPPDGGADAGTLPDAGRLDAAPPDAGPPAFTRYPDAVLSPITPSVVARMRAVAAAGPGQRDDVFLKAGGSGTVSTNLLYCFAGDAQPVYDLELDGRDALQPTIDFFRGGRVGDATPFDRATLAAAVGKTAAWALAGSPSPLEQELEAAQPRFAFVNYGTNDMEAAATYPAALDRFWERMGALLDRLEAEGVVPLVTGLNPRGDDAAAARWAPVFDAATRALLEARQLPYLSLYRLSLPLAGRGLGPDGLHGNFYSAGGHAQPCVFTPAGLAYNFNGRNLASIQTLDAARRTVLAGEPAPDAPGPGYLGAGSAADPFVVDGLPFTHAGDTRAGARVRDAYPDCDSGQDESGPEVVYHLALAAPTALRAVVLDEGDVNVDLHVLAGDTCLERDDRVVDRALPAGDYTIVVDTYTDKAGPYGLVLLACGPGDPDCD